MDTKELEALIEDHIEGRLSQAGAARLSALLEESAEARQRFWEEASIHGLLEQTLEQATLRVVTGERFEAQSRSRWLQWQPIAAAAAGILLGMFCATLAWAVVSPRAVATAARLFALGDGSFEKQDGPLALGFPAKVGVWSGDESVVVDRGAGGAKEGTRVLRFVSPGADPGDPTGRAISCDVFQLVDLRPLRGQLDQPGDSVLELSANFLDARPRNTQPSITFFCQIYLFSGDPEMVQKSWPQSIPEALSSGSAQTTTLGSERGEWSALTAKCLLPAGADFAVVQIAARPNLRPTKLDGLFADDIRLTLKNSPALPIRIVQR